MLAPLKCCEFRLSQADGDELNIVKRALYALSSYRKRQLEGIEERTDTF